MQNDTPEMAEELGTLCRTLEGAGEFGQLEALAIEWLARTPWAAEPHGVLLTCYIKRHDRPLAEALLAHFRKACPSAVRERESLERAFAVAFAMPAMAAPSAPVYTDDPKPTPAGLLSRIGRFIPARRAAGSSQLA